MNKNLLTFKLNDHAKIIIQLHHQNDVIDAGYEARLYFIHYNHRLLLSYSFVRTDIGELRKLLNKALNDELQADEIFTQDIGYSWNHTLNQKDISNGIFGENFDILNYYKPWSAGRCTWIYNNEQGNIVFEITPLYPHTYTYKKRKRSYNYFLKWMQFYKPIYKQIISREIAQQWIDQANQIIAEIDKNTAELYAQGKF